MHTYSRVRNKCRARLINVRTFSQGLSLFNKLRRFWTLEYVIDWHRGSSYLCNSVSLPPYARTSLKKKKSDCDCCCSGKILAQSTYILLHYKGWLFSEGIFTLTSSSKIREITKGQSISKCLFYVFSTSKKNEQKHLNLRYPWISRGSGWQTLQARFRTEAFG